jgi:hypothetical protein
LHHCRSLLSIFSYETQAEERTKANHALWK